MLDARQAKNDPRRLIDREKVIFTEKKVCSSLTMTKPQPVNMLVRVISVRCCQKVQLDDIALCAYDKHLANTGCATNMLLVFIILFLDFYCFVFYFFIVIRDRLHNVVTMHGLF